MKNRKGAITDEIGFNIVEMCVVAVLLVFLVGVFWKLWAASNTGKDDGSRANFESRLYGNIKKLMDSSIDKDCFVASYFIGSDKILVGFDTQWNNENKVVDFAIDKSWHPFNVYKPYRCGNFACLCLYNTGWKPDDAAKRGDPGIEICSRSELFADKNIIFLSEGGDISVKTTGKQREDKNGNYLVFYGKDFGVKRIYIEKNYKKEESKYYIYISRIDENKYDDPVNARKRQTEVSIQRPCKSD